MCFNALALWKRDDCHPQNECHFGKSPKGRGVVIPNKKKLLQIFFSFRWNILVIIFFFEQRKILKRGRGVKSCLDALIKHPFWGWPSSLNVLTHHVVALSNDLYFRAESEKEMLFMVLGWSTGTLDSGTLWDRIQISQSILASLNNLLNKSICPFELLFPLH